MATDERTQANGTTHSIVDEYKQLALYDIFKDIVGKLVDKDTVMQE